MKDNFFGNLLCAIDTETTGLDDRNHEIIELAIIPLGYDLETHPHHGVVKLNMRPDNIENIEPESLTVTGKTLEERLTSGLDKGVALDALYEWYDGLHLDKNSRIIPVAHNWVFDRGFLIEWIGLKGYETMFSHQPRDTMAMANTLNDRAWWREEDLPFPRLKLRECCTSAGIIMHSKAHSALDDANLCKQLYKYMITLNTLTRSQIRGT